MKRTNKVISRVKPGGEVFGSAVVDRDVEVAEVGQEVVETAGGDVDKGSHSHTLQQCPVGGVVGVAQKQVGQDLDRPVLSTRKQPLHC